MGYLILSPEMREREERERGEREERRRGKDKRRAKGVFFSHRLLSALPLPSHAPLGPPASLHLDALLTHADLGPQRKTATCPSNVRGVKHNYTDG